MKKLLSILLVGLMVLSAVACTSNNQTASQAPAAAPVAANEPAAPAQEPAAEPASEPHAPVSMSLCTADVGSMNYGYGATLCELVTEKSDWLTLTAQASAGMGENVRLTGTQEADFGITSTTGTYEGLTGTGAYDGETPYTDLRAVCVLNNGYNLMLAREGINSWEDLVGCKVGLGAAGSNTAAYATAVLKAYGIYDQVKCVNLSYDDCVQLMVDGEMDAYQGGTAPFASTVNLAAQMDIHPLPIDPDMFDKINEYARSFRYDVPATAYGHYEWLTEGVTTIGYSSYLVVNKNVPDDVVYEFLRIVLDPDNQAFLKEQLGTWQFDQIVERTEKCDELASSGLKLHDGALKYFADNGITVPDEIK